MTQTFDQWFQLRLDSLRRQNEWRKIDFLLACKEYVQDAFGFVPPGYALVPVEPTEDVPNEAERIAILRSSIRSGIDAAAPKDPTE